MLALYVAHFPWSWSYKLLHKTNNAVPAHPCHVADTGRAANMESVCTLTTGQKHPSFSHPKSVLHSKKLEVIAWTTNKLSA